MVLGPLPSIEKSNTYVTIYTIANTLKYNKKNFQIINVQIACLRITDEKCFENLSIFL